MTDEAVFEAVGPVADEAFALAYDIDQERAILKLAHSVEDKKLSKKLKEIREDAKNGGIPNEVFDATRKIWNHELKILQTKDGLAPDRKALVAFCHRRLGALSDTPLGEASTNQFVDRIAPERAPMTLDEAEAILAKPKSRGRPSLEEKAARTMAETIVVQSAGHSGIQAAN
jgi:hypothetical protein